MRRAAARFAGLVVAAACISMATVALTTAPVLACGCASVSQSAPVPDGVLVFTGIVTRIDDPQGSGPVVNTIRPLFVHFAVERVYDGGVSQSQVVSTAASSASCGFEFEVGQRYTVFTDLPGESGTPHVSLCGGTVSGAINPATYGLGTGSGPPGASAIWVIIAAAATSAVVLAAALMVRFRRREMSPRQ